MNEKPLDFNTIKKFALEQPDFMARLNTIQSTRIGPKNFAEIETAVNAFNKEKDETLAASVVRGLEADKSFFGVWGKLSKSMGGEMNMGELSLLKAAYENKKLSSDDVNNQALQLRSYGDGANMKLAEALERAYNDPEGLLEDDRKEIQEIAVQLSKATEAISRMAKRYAEKKNKEKVKG